MSRDFQLEFGAGTQLYSSFSEWEFILCHCMLEIPNLLLGFSRYVSQEIGLNVRSFLLLFFFRIFFDICDIWTITDYEDLRTQTKCIYISFFSFLFILLSNNTC